MIAFNSVALWPHCVLVVQIAFTFANNYIVPVWPNVSNCQFICLRWGLSCCRCSITAVPGSFGRPLLYAFHLRTFEHPPQHSLITASWRNRTNMRQTHSRHVQHSTRHLCISPCHLFLLFATTTVIFTNNPLQLFTTAK